MDLNERVSILEERTKPQQKSVIDRLKEWGGVATLIVALLYTFPLGVWDRFILSPKAREEASVRSLREVALQLARLDAEWALSADAIHTPNLRDMGMRAIGSQKITIITEHLNILQRFSHRLTAPELIILAYAVAQMNMHDFANDLYSVAGRLTEESGDLSLRSDVLRLQAQSELSKPKHINVENMRSLYSASLSALEGVENDGLRLQAAMTVFEWAQAELIKGHRGCADILLSEAVRRLNNLPHINTHLGHYRAQIDLVQKNVHEFGDDPSQVCDVPEVARSISG